MRSRTASRHLLTFLFLLLVVSSVSGEKNPDGEPPKPYIIKGRLTIQFEDGVSTESFSQGFAKANFSLPSLDIILEKYNVYTATAVFPWRKEKPEANSGIYDLTRFWEIYFAETADEKKLIEELLQNPNIRNVESVWALPIHASPDDPSWNLQWAMFPGGIDPLFYDAWDLETGSDSIKFANIDTGVNYRHPDLVGNVWVNPGEDLDGDGLVFDVNDLNGIDDDGNGIVDDLIGYDFFTGLGGLGTMPGEDGGVRDPDPNDFNSHGTHIAGIAAGMNNNGTGVTGIAGGWFGGSRSYRGVQIMCLRVGGTAADGQGYVNSTNCGQAIDYAAMMGADVINCSWGSQGTSAMVQGMSNAAAAGVTVVHASGNSNAEVPDFLDILGDDVLSVASTTSSDIKSGFSNFGDWIDISAPGSGIYSTVSFAYVPSYGYKSGTSMAAPMVCGTALLIKSMMPSLSHQQIDSIIFATADNIDAQNPSYIGFLGAGRINAYNALAGLANAKFSADMTEGSAPLTVQFSDLSPNSPFFWEWSFGTGDSSIIQNPEYTYTQPGVYSVSLRIDEGNPLGLGEEHLRNFIWVRSDTLAFDSIVAVKGQTTSLPVYLSNSSLIKKIALSFSLSNVTGVTVDSFDITASRTSSFQQVSFAAADPDSGKWLIEMIPDTNGGANYLPVGTGLFIELLIKVDASAPSGIIEIDTATISGQKTLISSIWGEYFPDVFISGKIVIGCAYGDANCDGAAANILDLTYMVDFIFRGGPDPDLVGGDANADAASNILDLTYLVDFIFRSGPPPPSS
ncbi:MAG: S8 family serine peptidase [candidate division Zixibacteria bacterium]|nr:S8 family serine peptidase [candidate division Zixibacteria bacterium]